MRVFVFWNGEFEMALAISQVREALVGRVNQRASYSLAGYLVHNPALNRIGLRCLRLSFLGYRGPRVGEEN